MAANSPSKPTQPVNLAVEAAKAIGILRSMGDAAPQAVVRQTATTLRQAQLWSEAAAAMEMIRPVTTGSAAERRYCANLAAMREARPELYASLMARPSVAPYEVFDPGSGRLLVGLVQPDGKRKCLSKSFNPDEDVENICGELDPHMQRGEPVFVCGLGDGYLLDRMWRRPPVFLFNRQVPVLLIATDTALIHALLHIHDWSSDTAPIRAARFVWCAGPDWLARLENLPETQPYLPIPKIVIRNEDADETVPAAVARLCADLSNRDESLRVQIAEHYRVKSREELLAALSPDPPRQPRIVIVTSRFTSVLQFAARDTAIAFRSLGWRADIAIEPADHLSIPQAKLRQILLDEKPDVVFLLDHVRHEVEGVFPPELPVVTWIQDLLPHLINSATAMKIGPRDFVLTCFAPMLAETYHYPARQLIDSSAMLTMRPDSISAAESYDIVYFSNVSGVPESLAMAAVQRCLEPDRPAATAAAISLLAHYRQGGAIPTIALLRDHVRRTTGATLDTASVTRIADKLWNPLNTGLYRQQALAWVRDAAARLNLSLAVFGNGWSDHPGFAPHARGYLAHGDATRAVMRAAKFNLHLEPYPCVSHHRLLDALAAGGLCLVREHPSHHLLPRLAGFLAEHGCAEAATADEARRLINPRHAATLESLLTEAATLNYHDSPDPIPQLRCWQRAGVVQAGVGLLPDLDAVTFRDAAGVGSLLRRFANDAAGRAELSERQWHSVEPRLTFAATMRRLVGEMRTKIADETP